MLPKTLYQLDWISFCAQVKALRQALKDIPSALDKNERFRRVSALVGGGHNKKDCYDKYKELKAEAKLKQTMLRTPSGMSTGSTSCRDIFPSSAGSGRLSLNSADASGQQQQQEQQGRSSTASATLSPVPSASESITGCSSTNRGTRGSLLLSHAACEHDSLEDMDEADQGASDSKQAPQGNVSVTMSDRAGGVAITRREGGAHGTAREAVNSEEKQMEIEEVDIEDFCLDDDLLVAEPYFVAGTTQTKIRGSSTGEFCMGRNSQISSASARGGDSGGGTDQLIERVTVTEVEANGVREILFGDPSKSFNGSWREQGFCFCGIDGLRYGLVQAKGGPCGVLAAAQAFLLEVCYSE